MPYFDFICDNCDEREEIFAQAWHVNLSPTCTCGEKMRRNWHAERFGGVTFRSKGRYGAGFIEDFAPGDQVHITSYDQHARELKKRGLAFKGGMSPEVAYSRKHIRNKE